MDSTVRHTAIVRYAENGRLRSELTGLEYKKSPREGPGCDDRDTRE